jgi:hypothetical protein
MLNPKPFIEGRGNAFCRGCLNDKLFTALDLGELPIANELLFDGDTQTEKFPLHLRICKNCGLGQVADVVTPERIFRNYRYLSSMSTTFLKHASDFVAARLSENFLTSDDWVLEIASNDGYLLKNFLTSNVKVIGVEPAENVAKIARELGINTISEFFSSRLATDILLKHGHPKLIIANNVVAHVPDLLDFMNGLSILAGPETVISVENPSLANIILEMQFDTVYHEHYSYLSATSIEKIAKISELQLFKVEELAIHGGSNRYWLRRLSEDSFVDESVMRVKDRESDAKIFEESNWIDLSKKVNAILHDLENWIKEAHDNKRKIYGYGAAAKASTLLNSISKQASESILGIADLSPEKQNRFLPPIHHRIVSPDELAIVKPTDILIFPWNISLEIASQLRAFLDPEIRYWCAIPNMHEVITK